MDTEDRPRPSLVMVIGENLDMISLTELAQRIEVLKAEIIRVEAEISKKQSAAAAAALFFKS